MAKTRRRRGSGRTRRAGTKSKRGGSLLLCVHKANELNVVENLKNAEEVNLKDAEAVNLKDAEAVNLKDASN